MGANRIIMQPTMSIEQGRLDKVESLAHEVIRVAVLAVDGGYRDRAVEAMREFRAEVLAVFGDPQVVINLIHEIRSRNA